MKRILMVTVFLLSFFAAVCSYSTDVKLIIDGKEVKEATISITTSGAIPDPVPTPTPVPSTKWGAVLQSGAKLNTKNSYIGWGYHERGTPGAVPVGPGGTIYFILDPNAYTGLDYTGRAISFRAVDYITTTTGSIDAKKTAVRLITVDRDGNEISAQYLAGESNQFAGVIYYTGPSKIYIIEVRQGDLRGANISSWWP